MIAIVIVVAVCLVEAVVATFVENGVDSRVGEGAQIDAPAAFGAARRCNAGLEVGSVDSDC